MFKASPEWISKRHGKKSSERPIAFFHTSTDDGDLQYQGCIVELRPDGGGKAVLFSALTGMDNGTYEFTPDMLDRMDLFDNTGEAQGVATSRQRQMMAKYERQCREAIAAAKAAKTTAPEAQC